MEVGSIMESATTTESTTVAAGAITVTMPARTGQKPYIIEITADGDAAAALLNIKNPAASVIKSFTVGTTKGYLYNPCVPVSFSNASGAADAVLNGLTAAGRLSVTYGYGPV